MKRVLSLLIIICAVFASAQNTKYVNLFMGTSGDNGQVSPGATVPFGMVCVSPDGYPRTHAGYNYETTEITGISINRLSGVGCNGAGGNIRIRPLHPQKKLHINKKTEEAIPGYYKTSFTNGIDVKLTATHSVAIEQYSFPKNLPTSLWIDFTSSFEGKATYHYIQMSKTCIEGYIQAKNVCGHGRYKLYFSLNTDQPFQMVEKGNEIPSLNFGPQVKEVEVRIGVSPLGSNQARKEWSQWKDKSFSQLKKLAIDKWKKQLSSISVDGGTEDDKVIFYTSLYRTFLSPTDVTSIDGYYLGTDGQKYQAEGFRYYSNWSLWDTFRTKFPLLVLLEPDRMKDIATSLLYLYQNGKNNWSTTYESTPTVRTEHAVILLLDTYRKGITNLNIEIGYEGMKKEMDQLSLTSPDQKMEAAYDLWAMAEIAELLGKDDDAFIYDDLSSSLFEETWKKEFMEITPDFEIMKNNGLYQGTRWQYRWAAPQYIDRIINWVGKDSLCAQLTYFFDNHLYNQGNEPDIHVPYLFNRLGNPEKTQQTVRNLISRPLIHKYGGNAEFKTPYEGKAFKNDPEGYCPEMDEDDGTMSAWYVFGAMGFYPLVVGDEHYELTAPLFDKIRIKLNNGKKLNIIAQDRENIEAPIQTITFNGKKIDNYQITHSDLLQGGNLVFNFQNINSPQ